MSSIKNIVSGTLRKTGLLYTADNLKFFMQKIKNYSDNKRFRKQNPWFVLPPDYFLYETFTLNYHEYMIQGKLNAEEIIDTVSQLTGLAVPGKRILDWGCGPARVVRHLPELLSGKHHIYGSDYNESYIDWCSRNLPLISFKTNKLAPPLAFEDNYFDLIYSVSILTHLSEKNHYDWIHEIKRVLKPGGILLISTQGNAYKDKMLAEEISLFEKGNLVIRSFSKEGHRIFSAFQPESFMRKLFSGFDIIEHQKGNETSIHGKQDTWIVKKVQG